MQTRANTDQLPGPSVSYEGFLKGIFSPVSNDRLDVDPERFVRMPSAVYDACWETRDRAVYLLMALDKVMRDPCHALIIAEGYDLGYEMPDIDQIHAELLDFRDFITSFDVDDVRADGQGFVLLNNQQAMKLNGFFNYNLFMLQRIFQAAFKTDYMQPFTNLRNAGYEYTGPQALQQAVNLQTGLIKVMIEVRKHKDLVQSVKDLVDFSYRNGQYTAQLEPAASEGEQSPGFPYNAVA